MAHQPAVIGHEEQLTYQELNTRANQLAYVLRRYGVGPNTLIGLCVTRSASMVVAVLDILKAGGAYVPLDPESPPARLTYQLQDTSAPLLLTQRSLLSRLPQEYGRILCLEDLQNEMERMPATNPVALHQSGDVAYVIYTSGSTGTPKGVMITHESVANYTLALCDLLKSEPGWSYATVSTLAADLGNTAIFCSLASGGCLQALPYEIIMSGAAFRQWGERHPIDVLKIVPSHLSALLAGQQELADEVVLPQQALVLGGEAFPASLWSQLKELGGTCRVFNHYGPTEATIGALVNPLPLLSAGKEEAGQGTTRALGRPIANVEAYVLNRGWQVIPAGVIGELYLGGAGLSAGYRNQPGQTAERFIPHPFSEKPGDRLYSTGDLVYYTLSGEIEFVGRRDNQVKVRGYRIELGEIEAVTHTHLNARIATFLLSRD